MKTYTLPLIVLLMVITSSCTTPHSTTIQNTPPEQPSPWLGTPAFSLASALTYYESMLQLPPATAQHYYDSSKNLLENARCSDIRLITAMLLTHPAIDFHADEKADNVLEPCLHKNPLHNAELRPLINILAIQISQKDTYERRGQSLQQEINAMRDQIDGLKAIEKSIQERETTESGPAMQNDEFE